MGDMIQPSKVVWETIWAGVASESLCVELAYITAVNCTGFSE